ncbi:MAG: LysR substrate-binding domain-containing protein [Rickettsiales bacterium]|nr:LysR substrate-binding domain-containing protein [Pseudomonadota bacterium]MDA0966960.1 LysR substrate-binding domain-containing protein [Pseudomonadota bacterium]MDG4543879.1 LysR substrate-binding domain-containing protein [Rickettsiales bacterium]MDG4546025.1 LysR substrate-binding domain-containing protein [Rickettsiales bacterium]MDG4548271.1 LysR substrate-binding domain-containing protein [Rickettsiales bacterium]
MKRNLPPLNSLKAFESAARHCSFTVAADELCVTQGAVSKQIKLLEEYLESELFIRTSSGLALTEKGEQYYLSLKEFFNNIENSTNYIFKDVEPDNLLTINILPSLTTTWLIPRIQDFKDKNTDIDVVINIGDGENIDFENINADIVIRVSDKPLKGAENEVLFNEAMLMVCTPSLIKDNEFKIEDITKYNLLEHTGRSFVWEQCLESLGISYKSKKNVLAFEHFFMITKAAKQGMGFALVPDIVVEEELEKGNLINPLNIKYETGYSYYMAYQERKKSSRKVRAFRNWLSQDY